MVNYAELCIDATMVRIGMMNMMMHGIKNPKVANINTLSDEYEKYFSDEEAKEINLDNVLSGKIKSKVS